MFNVLLNFQMENQSLSEINSNLVSFNKHDDKSGYIFIKLFVTKIDGQCRAPSQFAGSLAP